MLYVPRFFVWDDGVKIVKLFPDRSGKGSWLNSQLQLIKCGIFSYDRRSLAQGLLVFCYVLFCLSVCLFFVTFLALSWKLPWIVWMPVGLARDVVHIIPINIGGRTWRRSPTVFFYLAVVLAQSPTIWLLLGCFFELVDVLLPFTTFMNTMFYSLIVNNAEANLYSYLSCLSTSSGLGGNLHFSVFVGWIRLLP